MMVESCTITIVTAVAVVDVTETAMTLSLTFSIEQIVRHCYFGVGHGDVVVLGWRLGVCLDQVIGLMLLTFKQTWLPCGLQRIAYSVMLMCRG